MLSGTTALLLGLTTLGAAFTEDGADQSQQAIANTRPIGSQLAGARARQLESPEVVLSVKYDRGSIGGIYLAQYRKGKDVSSPSVPEGTQLCQDLCHAGLGGDGCGSSCRELVPVGLLQATGGGEPAEGSSAEHTQEFEHEGNIGRPRTGVCPVLCSNNLGYPLCSCKSDNVSLVIPNWSAVCAVFCSTDAYTLGGCPACQHGAVLAAGGATRALDTAAGWKAWCSLQCGQGQGGAACNCDILPFSL